MKALCEGFVNFFENKLERIRAPVDAMSCNNHVIVDGMPPAVSSLDVTSTMEVLASIRKLKLKTCSLAILSTRLLKAIDC